MVTFHLQMQLNPCNLAFHPTLSHNFSTNTHRVTKYSNKKLDITKERRITTVRAVETDNETEATKSDEPPAVNFAFVSSVLLPDGTPDVHFRTACGGQKLRDIMLDSHMELYGPYSRPLLNCGGGGTCGTCLVEVVEGRELLSPRTDKEKEKLKRNPKNWRLACQTTVGEPDSRGLTENQADQIEFLKAIINETIKLLVHQVVIQQLPEWKGHEWNYNKIPPSESEIGYIG